MSGLVLVAVASTADAEAIVQAHEWAERTESALLAVHAVAAPHITGLDPATDKRAQTIIRTACEQEQGKLSERIASLTGRWHFEAPSGGWRERVSKAPTSESGRPDAERFEVQVVVGSPHAVVLQEAEDRDPSLIVVGASPKGPIDRWWLGSSAGQIVRHASVPVLVARSSPRGGVVAVASDLSDPSMPAIEAAVAEAGRRGAELVAVHSVNLAHPVLSAFEPAVVIDGKTAEVIHAAGHRTLKASLERFGGSGRTLVVDGPPHRAVGKAAADLEAALLVVGTHGRTGLLRVALGSVAESVAREASCSVLIVR